jgi:hypothetical protein
MVVSRGIMRLTSRGKLWTSLGNLAEGELQGPGAGAMQDFVPCLALSAERRLDLNFFGSLSP